MIKTTNNNQMTILNDCLNLLYKEGINETNIKIVFNMIMEINGMQDKTRFSFNNKTSNVAQFVPKYNEILISPERIPTFLYNNVDNKDTNIFPTIENRYLLKCYLIIMVLVHELEHAKQYLIGKEELPSPSILVTKGYNNINNLLINPNYIIPRPIKTARRYISLALYLAKQNDYILERNANLEAFYTTGYLANYKKDQDISINLLEAANLYLKHGYRENTLGNLYETHKELLMLDKLPKTNDYINLDLATKSRYGLPITETERKSLLK